MEGVPAADASTGHANAWNQKMPSTDSVEDYA